MRRVSVAFCEREHWRVQQDWYLARPSGRHGIIPSTLTKSVYANANGLDSQAMGSLRISAWLPHLYVAQPPCGFHYSHFLVMDWIPNPGACTAFARIFDDNRPVSRFGHPGAAAFGFC